MKLYYFYRSLLFIANSLCLYSVQVLSTCEDLIEKKIRFRDFFLNLFFYLCGVILLVTIALQTPEKFAFAILIMYIVISGLVVLNNLFTALMVWFSDLFNAWK